MMGKSLALCILICVVFYLSNTPNLKVAEVETWTNEPQFEKNVVDLSFIMDKESVFYDLYSDFYYRDFFLHKASHVLFYGVLSILIYFNLPKMKNKALSTMLLIFLFALSDEIHQFFVIGRSGRLVDVILDCTAAYAFLLVYLIRVKQKKNAFA